MRGGGKEGQATAEVLFLRAQKGPLLSGVQCSMFIDVDKMFTDL